MCHLAISPGGGETGEALKREEVPIHAGRYYDGDRPATSVEKFFHREYSLIRTVTGPYTPARKAIIAAASSSPGSIARSRL